MPDWRTVALGYADSMLFGNAAGRDQVRPFVWLVAAKNGKVRWLGVPSPPSERITDQRLPVFRTTTAHSFGPSLCAAASCSDYGQLLV